MGVTSAHVRPGRERRPTGAIKSIALSGGLFSVLGLMKPSHDQHNDFLAHRPLPGVSFEHNDTVIVVAGEHAGRAGSIVSIEALGSDPVFLVELGSGKDVDIAQSNLRLAEG